MKHSAKNLRNQSNWKKPVKFSSARKRNIALWRMRANWKNTPRSYSEEKTCLVNLD